ncbi:MAG: tRNA pseudouridine(38-40) synthase TruA [Nocardioides sp.]
MRRVRIRIDLAYDGGGFNGWAIQPGLRTVQGDLEAALATVLRLESVRVVCAGRTDTRVHARGQVAHADVPGGTRCHGLLRRLNGVLDTDVRVRGVRVAADGFDARFSAMWRRYAYRVADVPELADPLSRGFVLEWPRRLDLPAMNAASSPLLGLHDFAAFCKRREGATTRRTLLHLAWSRDDVGVAVADVRADAFCHGMVRSLVGCLLAVGDGRHEPEWAAHVLTAAVRDPKLKVARARGLTLEEVGYPADDALAGQTLLTRQAR